MKKMLAFALASFIFLSGCSLKETPDQQKAGQESDIPIHIDASNAEIKPGEGAFKQVTLLNDYIDRNKFAVLGFDESGNVLSVDFEENTICSVNLNTHEQKKLINIPIRSGHYMNRCVYGSNWFVWAESTDEVEYVGSSAADDWAIYGMNLLSGEKISIDCENEYFPKKRSFFAVPVGWEITGNILAYNGYSADKDGVYKAVKYYDFSTKRLYTIIDEDIKTTLIFSQPSVTSENVVFCGVKAEDLMLQDSEIYVYNIASKKLSKIENSNHYVNPSASDRYIVAENPWREDKKCINLEIYDLRAKKWISEINENASIFKNYQYHGSIWTDQPKVCGKYVVFHSSVDAFLYVYDIENNVFYCCFEDDGTSYLQQAYFLNGRLVWSRCEPMADNKSYIYFAELK